MPRVTRRSVASKEEESSTDEKPTTDKSRSASRGRRGAKKDETAEASVDEPQEATPKKGGRQAAKETPKTPTPKGRATSRGGRGKKEEEPEVKKENKDAEENAKEEEEEEEAERPQRGGTRSRSQVKGARGGKAAARGGRSTRGRAAEEEEEVENVKEEKAEQASKGENEKESAKKKVEKAGVKKDGEKNETAEEATPVKGRGGRGQAKVAAVTLTTPSSKSGRRSRGKAAEEEKEEESTEVNEDKAETSKDDEIEATPTRGRGRRSLNKAAEPTAPTPPSSSGRRGRSQKAEPAPKTSPAPGRSSRRCGDAVAEEESEKKEEAAEPMETEAAESTVENMETDTAVTVEASTAAAVSPSKKRKLQEEEETGEHAPKRQRTSKSEVSKEAQNELDGFVVINKEDVPAPDSKEVTESLPPEAGAKTSKPPVPEDTRPEGPKIQPEGSFVVPLTEAELAKQYTPLQRQDRDETSSTQVEVGSEGVADITGLSSRGLDNSDAVSLDSTSLDQPQGDNVSEQAMDSSSSSSLPAQECSIASPIQSIAQDVVPQQVNATEPTPVTQQNVSSNATSAPTQAAAAPPTPPHGGVTNASRSPAAPVELHTGSAALVSESNAIPSQLSQTPSQNGTAQDTALVNSSPVLKSTPYVPSSIAIDNRKFIHNPAFPSDLMDPALWFSVVSYNILADCHMRRSDYSYTQPQFLEQTYRHVLLLKELDYLDADIVCLQEVNPAYYTQTLLPAMSGRGYGGNFVKRTKDYWDEGEATFVRTAKFDIVSSQSVSLGELAFKEVDESGVSAEVNRAAKKYLDRADVVLLTELLCKKTGRNITVCNIHVVYDKAAPDVQCIQVACAVKQLVAKAGNDLNPHVICGDFNSVVTSPGYQLAKDGYLSDDHIGKLQTLENLDNTDGSSQSLIHHMWRAFQHTSSNLRSAYELTLDKEPPITSYTNSTHGTLDYIFHSASSIDTVGVLETLDEEVVDASGGLPSKNIPSDHLSLKAVFRLKDAA